MKAPTRTLVIFEAFSISSPIASSEVARSVLLTATRKWYRIASSPWSNQLYVSADAFYNNGQTYGSLIGTPFVDPSVANC